jgi:hypothetical protein
MAIEYNEFGGKVGLTAFPAAGRGEDMWRWEPEPMRLAPIPIEQAAPSRFDVLTGSLQVPVALVDERTQTLVEGARCLGKRHALSLWRSALREALERTAREAVNMADDATCVALFWDRVGEEYRISVTFEWPARRAAQNARH